jgi:hypothetical protein
MLNLNASKTLAARANSFSMRVNRWRVAALFVSHNRVTIRAHEGRGAMEDLES